jgi:hypothetical protein
MRIKQRNLMDASGDSSSTKMDIVNYNDFISNIGNFKTFNNAPMTGAFINNEQYKYFSDTGSKRSRPNVEKLPQQLPVLKRAVDAAKLMFADPVQAAKGQVAPAAGGGQLE